MSHDPRDQLIEELRATIARLEAKVADLEEKLRKSSSNSSKPPSSDGPGASHTKPNRRKRSGKKRGAQPGHPKHDRPLVPIEQVDAVYDVKPTKCEACDARLRGDDPEPVRHQVTDLPVVIPTVTEYRLHALGCRCGHVTCGELPPGVPRGAFGPGVVATVAVLIGAYRLSKRLVVDVLRDLMGLDISTGSVIRCQREALCALTPCIEEAAAHVEAAPVKHGDETSWREAGARAWLWAVVTPVVTFFAIHSRRSAEAAKVALGAGRGVLVSDRFSGYSWWPLWRRQVCWSHLIRDFVAIAERGGASGRIGTLLGEEADRLFAWHHRVRDGTLSHSTFKVYVRSLQKRVRALVLEGKALTDQPKTAKTCAKMLRVFPAFWYFVDHPEVEPTNNAAEQAVRHGVMYRKTSQGTQSAHGSAFVAAILTVHATLRRQRRDIRSFVVEACRARLLGNTPPSLLYAPAPAAQRATATLHAA
ncbi:MAG: IS66 family transposase [Coriobacteriia bacterium]|nr:IS66 family transposase [Coriobacteriia bacterium]